MLEKEIKFPREFRLVERQATSDRIEFDRLGRSGLNAGDDLDCLLDQTFRLFVGNFFEDLTQLSAAQVLLHDYSGAAINVVDLGHRQVGFNKQSGNVEIRMNRRIERF